MSHAGIPQACPSVRYQRVGASNFAAIRPLATIGPAARILETSESP